MELTLEYLELKRLVKSVHYYIRLVSHVRALCTLF
jgi:hypothetical protein